MNGLPKIGGLINGIYAVLEFSFVFLPALQYLIIVHSEKLVKRDNLIMLNNMKKRKHFQIISASKG